MAGISANKQSAPTRGGNAEGASKQVAPTRSGRRGNAEGASRQVAPTRSGNAEGASRQVAPTRSGQRANAEGAPTRSGRPGNAEGASKQRAPTRGGRQANAEDAPKRGGWRPNAGRKRSPETKYDPSHSKRPALSFKHPVHVMLRTLASVPRLRQRDGYEAIRAALLYFVDGASFRVVHISIQRNHLHLIVEAAHKEALRRGMQRFAIRAARPLNREFGREGKVFAFRYHAKQIKTPDYARNVLSYVLNNWRRHREDRYTREESMPFDQFSSAWAFTGWSTSCRWKPPDDGLPVSPPRTQLLTFDWELRGLIDPFEVPGPLSLTV